MTRTLDVININGAKLYSRQGTSFDVRLILIDGRKELPFGAAPIFNPNKDRVSDAAQERRMEICRACPFFIKITTQCSKCACIMTQKTKLADASCPIGKWGINSENLKEKK